MLKKRAAFLILLMALPLQAKIRNKQPVDDKPAATSAPHKPRRYKIKDTRGVGSEKGEELARFLETAGTLGVLYFWPGLSYHFQSQNVVVKVNNNSK